MQDLNATMFYKAKFTVTAKDSSDTDLLWILVMEIRAWLLRKWNRNGHKIVRDNLGAWTRFKNGGKLFDEEKTNHIYAESIMHVSDPPCPVTSWACKIVESPAAKEDYAPREWITEIGFQLRQQGGADISYVVTYSDQPGFIGFCEEVPSISVPRVIRGLLSHRNLICHIGPDRLTTQPVCLAPGDYPAFQKVVFNPQREVPVIYISPKRAASDSDEAAMLVSPDRVAESVAANALVFCSDSLDFSREMRYMEDERYTCFGGAIRIYRPGIDANNPDDPYKHRFVSASFIEAEGEERILDIFRRALAQDVHFYETMFRLENCKALIEEDAHQKRIASIRAKSETEVDEAMQEFLDESDRREEAERQARIYRDELNRQKEENYDLSLQNDILRSKAAQARQIESSVQAVRAIRDYPDKPWEIAKYFETVYPERIAFTERAYGSLKDCKTKNDYLWEIFYYIATELFDLVHNSPAQAYKTFTEKTGWACSRGEGSMTRSDASLMRQYIDTYQGQEINIEAHIKNGSKDSDPRSVRIYFAYDPQVADKIIIGHCGKHLDNYSTRKVR